MILLQNIATLESIKATLIKRVALLLYHSKDAYRLLLSVLKIDDLLNYRISFIAVGISRGDRKEKMKDILIYLFITAFALTPLISLIYLMFS